MTGMKPRHRKTRRNTKAHAVYPTFQMSSGGSAAVCPRTAITAALAVKFLAAAGLALGIGSLGLFASAGTAAADGMDLDVAPPAIMDEDGTWGAADVSGQRGGDWVPAVHAYDTSSYPATPSWPG